MKEVGYLDRLLWKLFFWRFDRIFKEKPELALYASNRLLIYVKMYRKPKK